MHTPTIAITDPLFQYLSYFHNQLPFMKVYAFIFFLLLARLCHAQADGEASIRGLLDEQTRSWNRGDIDGFMKTYWKSDSLMFVGKSGITYGWENTRDGDTFIQHHRCAKTVSGIFQRGGQMAFEKNHW